MKSRNTDGLESTFQFLKEGVGDFFYSGEMGDEFIQFVLKT